MKKFTKLVSLTVTAIMLMMSLAGMNAFAAETDKYYTTIDISAHGANGKFWVDPTIEYDITISNYNQTIAQGGCRDFISSVGGVAVPKAAVYPMQFKSVKNYNPGKAWVMSDNSLRSPSGVPYILPVKTATVDAKEAIILSDSTWSGNQSVNIKRNVNKVHFIVASAGKMKDDGTTGVKVEAVYTDAENYTQDASTFAIGSYSDSVVKTDSNALCYINSYEEKGSTFAAVGDWGGEIVLREYSIDITHPEAQLSYLKFSQNGTNAGSFAIFAITTEDASGETAAGLASAAPALADGSYSVVASSPVTGKAVLAIYEKATNKLVAVKFADITAGNQTQTITAESENIVAGTEYAAQVMLLDGIDTLVPLTNALPIG